MGIRDAGCSLAPVKTGVQPHSVLQRAGCLVDAVDSVRGRIHFGSACLMSGWSQQQRDRPQSRPSQNQPRVEASEGALVEIIRTSATSSLVNQSLRIIMEKLALHGKTSAARLSRPACLACRRRRQGQSVWGTCQACRPSRRCLERVFCLPTALRR